MVFLTLVSGIYVTEAELDKIFLPDASLDLTNSGVGNGRGSETRKHQVIEEDIL